MSVSSLEGKETGVFFYGGGVYVRDGYPRNSKHEGSQHRKQRKLDWLIAVRLPHAYSNQYEHPDFEHEYLTINTSEGERTLGCTKRQEETTNNNKMGSLWIQRWYSRPNLFQEFYFWCSSCMQ